MGKREEMVDLQKALEGAPDYWQRVTGRLPGKADAQSEFTVLPDGKAYDDKFVFGIYLDDEIIGCADVIRGYPNAETAALGLLLIKESFQKKGFGFAAYGEIEKVIRSWDGCKRIRLWVVSTNDLVTPFWEKMGFQRTGERVPYKCDNLSSEVTTFEKIL